MKWHVLWFHATGCFYINESIPNKQLFILRMPLHVLCFFANKICLPNIRKKNLKIEITAQRFILYVSEMKQFSLFVQKAIIFPVCGHISLQKQYFSFSSPGIYFFFHLFDLIIHRYQSLYLTQILYRTISKIFLPTVTITFYITFVWVNLFNVHLWRASLTKVNLTTELIHQLYPS